MPNRKDELPTRNIDPNVRSRRVSRPVAGVIAAMLGVAGLGVVPIVLPVQPAAAATSAARSYVWPSTRSVPAGESTAYVVNIVAGRPSRKATTTITGVPSGVTARFVSTSIRSRWILLVNTSRTASVGSHAFMLETRTSSGMRQTAVRLTIGAAIGAPSTIAPPATTVAPPPTLPNPTVPPTTAPITVAPTTTAPPPTLTLRASPSLHTIVAGQEASYDITPDPLGATFTYYVAGAPADARVEFVPNPSFGRTTMVLRTTANTPAGLYTLTISGLSSTGVTTVAVVLAVQNLSGLSADPSTRTVAPGGSASYIISVTSAAVPLGFVISGLPSGSGAFFSSPVSSIGTTLTVTTSASTPVGSYSLVLSGTANGVVRTITLQLVVTTSITPPSFGVAVLPGSGTVARGSNVAFNLAITPQGGFVGPVSVAVTGLPAAAFATYTPVGDGASLGGQIIVFVSGTTPVGTHIFRVTATGSGLTATVDVTLQVT